MQPQAFRRHDISRFPRVWAQPAAPVDGAGRSVEMQALLERDQPFVLLGDMARAISAADQQEQIRWQMEPLDALRRSCLGFFVGIECDPSRLEKRHPRSLKTNRSLDIAQAAALAYALPAGAQSH